MQSGQGRSISQVAEMLTCIRKISMSIFKRHDNIGFMFISKSCRACFGSRSRVWQKILGGDEDIVVFALYLVTSGPKCELRRVTVKLRKTGVHIDVSVSEAYNSLHTVAVLVAKTARSKHWSWPFSTKNANPFSVSFARHTAERAALFYFQEIIDFWKYARALHICNCRSQDPQHVRSTKSLQLSEATRYLCATQLQSGT